jgi:opacity protein-like surface antigen
MKKHLAILALVSIILGLPLAAQALPTQVGACQGNGGSQEAVSSATTVGDDANGQEEFENQGDPDEIGGGFRGTGAPPEEAGVVGPGYWLGPVFIFLMQLF